MMLSDRIGVMREGRIVQMGTPDEVYHHPATPFVAHFLGETNLLPCEYRSGDDGPYAVVTYADGTTGLVRRTADDPEGGQMQVSVRPERIEFLDPGETRDNQTNVVVTKRVFLGSQTRYTVAALGATLVAVVPDTRTSPQLHPDERVRVGWSCDDAQLLTVPDGPESSPAGQSS